MFFHFFAILGINELFAADIEKHLQGLPIAARPLTLRYRGGKFVQRNRLLVVASALAVISLLSGLAVAVWQARVARDQARRANSAQAVPERESQRSRAESEHAHKDFAQAVRLDNEALSLFRQQYGDAYFNVARIYTHLSKVSEAQGKTAQAAAYRREAERRMNNLSNRTDAEAVKKLSRLLARTQIMSDPLASKTKAA